MGEQKRVLAQGIKAALSVDTFGGRVQVRWEPGAAATPFGQLAFFIEFLQTSGLFEQWRKTAPLQYSSGNAPAVNDVLGTWFLAALAGHWRYAHVSAIRHDGVSPGLLGMDKVVSEDALRRALERIDSAAGAHWQQAALQQALAPLLTRAWVLDIDTTVKPLYGHQEAAVVGYNPHKPGRPSHSYHSYLMAGLRLVLDVEVQAGNATHSHYSAPGLHALLDRLPRAHWPRFVRGDTGFGNEAIMSALEARQLPYLFKLRATANVKRLIEKHLWRQQWRDAGQGWQGVEDSLQLHGWTRARRVVLLRRPLQGEVVATDDHLQLSFLTADAPLKRYEYSVLVSDLPYDLVGLGQLYRDRADCENNFDELKNQWGWGGFTTRDLHRCQLSARHVALIYNWWTLFALLADPKQRREAITSRPLLLHSIGRSSRHAGQTSLRIAATHAQHSQAQAWLTEIHALLQTVKRTAEQLPTTTAWQRIIDLLIRRLHAAKRFIFPPPLRQLMAEGVT
jgi:Transposase DDE domain group 1